MQKGFASILVLILILVIAGGAYLYNQSNQEYKQESQSTPSTYPPLGPPQEESQIPLPSSITEKIKVVPIDKDKFSKQIVDSDDCNNPIGLVSYTDISTNSWMKINSELLPGNTDSKKGISDLFKFLEMGKTSDWQDVGSFENAFREYCGGHYSYLIREIDGVNYSNVDKSRSLMIIAGNGVYGHVATLVYAINGDNVIQLSRYLDEQKLYDNHINICESQNNGQPNVECYKQRILKDEILKAKAKSEANRLVTLFAIK